MEKRKKERQGGKKRTHGEKKERKGGKHGKEKKEKALTLEH